MKKELFFFHPFESNFIIIYFSCLLKIFVINEQKKACNRNNLQVVNQFVLKRRFHIQGNHLLTQIDLKKRNKDKNYFKK